MAIKGSLNEASLPDIIQLLSVGQKTGVLSITNRQNFGNIYLKDGNVIYANIVNREDRIGDILIRRGRISKNDLDQAIKMQHEHGQARLLGTILVEMGLLKADELKTILHLQIEEAIYTLLTWRDGFFVFEPNRLPEESVPTVQIRTSKLVMEAARRIDEWEVMRKRIPSLNIRVMPLYTQNSPQNPLKDKDSNYSEEELSILALVNGERTIQDLADMMSLNEFDVAKIIYGFLTAQLVEIAKEVEIPQEPAALIDHRLNEARNLGFAFLKAELYGEARKEYEKILQYEPDDPQTSFYLGLIAYHQRQYDRAITYYTKVMELNNSHRSIYNNLAMAYEHMGDLKNAIIACEKGLEKNAHHLRMQINLGRLMILANELNRAQEIFENAKDRDPDFEIPYFYLSVVYIKQKNYEKALGLLESVYSETSAPVLQTNYAIITDILGNSKKAIDLFKSALKDEPNLIEARHGLADIYYRNGWHQDALSEYLRVVELNQNSSEAYFKIGNIHMKYQEKNKAIESWEKSLALDPDNELLRRNIETVKKLKMVM